MRSAARIIAIEKTMDRTASALLALACGAAGYAWFGASLERPVQVAAAAACAAIAFLLGLGALSSISPGQRKLPVTVFDVRNVEPMEAPELLLTERVAEHGPAEEPLVLDDILSKLAPDSRVVRLFDPAAMPTPAELKSRIDRHLDREAMAAQSEDAAQALHDALAELRRSLR